MLTSLISKSPFNKYIYSILSCWPVMFLHLSFEFFCFNLWIFVIYSFGSFKKMGKKFSHCAQENTLIIQWISMNVDWVPSVFSHKKAIALSELQAAAKKIHYPSALKKSEIFPDYKLLDLGRLKLKNPVLLMR